MKSAIERTRMPPVEWIRYFTVAAQFDSFVKAGEVLSVSSGAVSYRIKSLEQFLGVTLFERTARGVRITETGQIYADLVREPIERIAEVTGQILDRELRSELKVTIMPTLADLWLMPNLGDFYERYPDVSVILSGDAALLDLKASGFDIAIRRSDDLHGHDGVHELFGESLFPVATPEFIRANKLTDLSQILEITLLGDLNWPNDWPQWFEAAGLSGPRPAQCLEFSLYGSAIDAALRNRGILMAHDALVREHLESGELQEVFDVRIKSKSRYFALLAEAADEREHVQAFLAWLLEIARASPNRHPE